MNDTPNPNVFFRGDDMGIGNFPIKGGKMSNQPINDGGPAFPNVPSDPGYTQWDTGMTLRDYFAAKALHGIISDPNNWSNSKKDMESVSHAAYEFADAMLKARGDK